MRVVNPANRLLVAAPLGLFLLWGCGNSNNGIGSGGGNTASGTSSSSSSSSSSSGGSSTATTSSASSGGAGSAGTRSTVASSAAGQTATGGTTVSSTTSAKGGTTASTTSATTASTSGGTTGGSTGGAASSRAGGTTAKATGGTTANGTGGTTAKATGGSTGSAGSTGTTAGYPLGNPAVPSDGCGKALSTFKSGANTSYKITSATLNREYIIYIPSSYDSSKPYRLVFGMHCMGSSATQCANSDQFYRLKPLDTGNTTIFVAPQGYTDGSPWRGGDNKDHIFFEDMVKLFKSELCIDTSRIFSAGFSFGAMFTNSLGQTEQDILRGAIVYATADYNIYFPANSGKRLAYMGVHGTADGTCPFKSGQSSIARYVKNNGCTTPATVPQATSSTHVVYDYECPSNYPVKWATHNGGHTDLPMDPGQSKSWAIDLTWKFITQF